MANDLDVLIPQILARGVLHLRGRTIMPQIVNSDLSDLGAQRGDTIDVQIPTAVGTRAVTPAAVGPSAGDHDVDSVQVSLNQWRQNDPIHVTDQELDQMNTRQDYLPPKLKEAINSLASEVNAFIIGKYPKIYNVVGTAGTTPFGSGVEVKSATQTRKVLNIEKAPITDRAGVLDFDAEAAALELSAFSDAEKVMSAEVKIEGDIGRKFGIDWFADDDVPTHTAGTVPATVAVNVALAAGDVTFDADEGAGAATTIDGKTLLVGDVIQFTGYDGTYAIIANAASSHYSAGVYTGDASDDIGDVGLYPAVREIIADDTVIILTATHVVNLVFHRDAFAYAMRPLADGLISEVGGSQIISMTDPLTGLTMRLEVKRQHKQIVWEFDLLYGAELVRPELAVRLLG